MLSKRLQTIASFIDNNDNVIDIGCDHGYLSIYMVRNIKCQKVIASDINQNALNSAINNIKKAKLSNRIETILSDGLNDIDSKDYNTIVISGMGTSTILHILDNKDKLEGISKIVVQSNNNHYFLRKEMVNRGYMIINEKTVLDSKKYYIIIEFTKGKTKYNQLELYFGPKLIKDKININYFKNLYNQNLNILKLIPKNKILLRIKLKRKLNNIERIINNY